MPVICLGQHFIKLILVMVVCLVVLKDSQSSAALSDVVQLKRWPPWSYGFMPLPFVTLTSGASFVFMYLQSYFGN
jgi:hypothetical protein